MSRYSEQRKATIVGYARRESTNAAVKKYGVTATTIRAWRKNGHAPEPPVQSAASGDAGQIQRLTEENRKLKQFVFEKMFLPTILG